MMYMHDLYYHALEVRLDTWVVHNQVQIDIH